MPIQNIIDKAEKDNTLEPYISDIVNKAVSNISGVTSFTASQISDSTSAGRTLLTSNTQGQRESLAIVATATNFASLPSTGLSQRIYITTNDWKTYGWISSLNQYKEISPSQTLPVEYIVACSDESSSLTAGTAKVTFRSPINFRLTGVSASLNIAPSGSNIIVDINNNGNSVLSTKLSIDTTEKTSLTAASTAVIDTNYRDFTKDSEITIDIDQIGSQFAGVGLKTTLLGERL